MNGALDLLKKLPSAPPALQWLIVLLLFAGLLFWAGKRWSTFRREHHRANRAFDYRMATWYEKTLEASKTLREEEAQRYQAALEEMQAVADRVRREAANHERKSDAIESLLGVMTQLTWVHYKRQRDEWKETQPSMVSLVGLMLSEWRAAAGVDAKTMVRSITDGIDRNETDDSPGEEHYDCAFHAGVLVGRIVRLEGHRQGVTEWLYESVHSVERGIDALANEHPGDVELQRLRGHFHSLAGELRDDVEDIHRRWNARGGQESDGVPP